MPKKGPKNIDNSVKAQSDAVKDIDEGLVSISGRHKLIKQQIDAQTASLEAQKVAYDSITKAQQKGADVDKEVEKVKKRIKKEQTSLNDAAKETKEAFDAIGESLDQIGGSGVTGMRELVAVLKESKLGGKALTAALFALGAAAGAAAYNFGLIGDKLGTLAKWNAKIIPLQASLDLLKADIRGTFAGQRAAGEFGFQMQRMATAFERASATALFGNKLGSVGYGSAQLQYAGISADKIAESMTAAADATGQMPTAKIASDMAVLQQRTNQSAEGIASINEMFMRLDGSSASVALNMQEGLRTMANQANINLGALMTEMAESSKEMLGYQIKSGSALAKQVTFAQSMGVSFQDVAKAGKSMVMNYKDSIKAEMQLSSLLGEQVDLSEVRASFAAGDTEGALKALKAQGLNPEDMDMFQQEALQQALGGLDLNALSKISKNTGKEVGLGAGNVKAGNQSFLGRTEAAGRQEEIKNAAITVAQGKFDIKMTALEEEAINRNPLVRQYELQIKQLEAMRDAEVGLTEALIAIATGLATSGIGGLFQKGGLKNAKELLMGPKPGQGGNALWNETKYAKNAAGRYIDPTTKRFVSNKAVAEAKSAGKMGGMTRTAKIGGSVVAGAIGAYEGYQNFDAKRKGETETRTTDKMGAGFVQGGLAAAGTAIGAAFGGPIGMMIGGFLGNTLGESLNKYAPGLAQGVGDIFTGMSKGWDRFKERISKMFEAFKPLTDLFDSLAKKLGFEEGGMSGILQKVGGFIFDSLILPFSILISSFTAVGNIVGGFIKIFSGDFKQGFADIGNAVLGFFGDILSPFKGIFASIWNWIADSRIGKFFGMTKMEVAKEEPKKAEAAKDKVTTTATTGVDTKVAAATVGDNYTGRVELGDAGTKSITAAITANSKWLQDKLVYMSGNLEKVVDRTSKTAANTAEMVTQTKTMNTNTKAILELTRKIEALTRATYEGGTVVKVDGKTLATAVSNYNSDTQGQGTSGKVTNG